MGNPDRAEREKINDITTLREVMTRHGIFAAPEEALSLDTSTLTPAQAAQLILDLSEKAAPGDEELS